jgi:hypothetical protein
MANATENRNSWHQRWLTASSQLEGLSWEMRQTAPSPPAFYSGDPCLESRQRDRLVMLTETVLSVLKKTSGQYTEAARCSFYTHPVRSTSIFISLRCFACGPSVYPPRIEPSSSQVRSMDVKFYTHTRYFFFGSEIKTECLLPSFRFLSSRLLVWPPLWSSGQSSWLQIQRSRVRFPALPDFLRSSGCGG